MLRHSFALVLSFSFFLPFIIGNPVQKQGLSVPPEYQAARDDVGNVFVESYMAYKSVNFRDLFLSFYLVSVSREYAFGHDSLAPVSKGFLDGRNGWGATIVDAMDTMASNLRCSS
jgi:mannosyl-oligosaccharide alpha-1,2-mannosidase